MSERGWDKLDLEEISKSIAYVLSFIFQERVGVGFF